MEATEVKKGLLEAEPLKVSCKASDGSEQQRSGRLLAKPLPARGVPGRSSAPRRSPGRSGPGFLDC